jgi:membrane protein DedA with SNARE-associated domain
LALFDIFNFALNLMAETSYLGIFALMAAESATLPVPSEVVLPLAGYLVFQGRIDFWGAVVAATLGSLVGTTADYCIGYYLGRPVILKYGRWVRLTEHHLSRSETWFTRYGNPAVFLARFVPLVRTVIAFPAGIAKMSFTKFLAFSAVGILVWDIVLIYLGELAGLNSSLIVNSLQSAFLWVEIAAAAIFLVALYVYTKRSKKNPSQL